MAPTINLHSLAVVITCIWLVAVTGRDFLDHGFRLCTFFAQNEANIKQREYTANDVMAYYFRRLN